LAIRYKLDGVYIPAFNQQINFIKYLMPINFKIIGSAHSKIEVLIKQKQGCKIIFVSPIFEIKKKNYFLDVIKFNLLTLNKKIEFVALGGITKRNKNRLNLLSICGFAGISYFQKKTASQGGRLNS
jgi:thiamine-phosphate pyrophosphorylase